MFIMVAVLWMVREFFLVHTLKDILVCLLVYDGLVECMAKIYRLIPGLGVMIVSLEVSEDTHKIHSGVSQDID